MIYEGEGGTKTVVGGVEFWENGEPPRKYKLLGIINDDRLVNLVQMLSLKKDVAKKTKQVGGDAVIILSSSSRIIGYQHNAQSSTMYRGSSASTQTSGSTRVNSVNSTKFAVIAYIPDAVPAK